VVFVWADIVLIAIPFRESYLILCGAGPGRRGALAFRTRCRVGSDHSHATRGSETRNSGKSKACTKILPDASYMELTSQPALPGGRWLVLFARGKTARARFEGKEAGA